eukprot:5052232-Pyramimonas_sp.AAC.1
MAREHDQLAAGYARTKVMQLCRGHGRGLSPFGYEPIAAPSVDVPPDDWQPRLVRELAVDPTGIMTILHIGKIGKCNQVDSAVQKMALVYPIQYEHHERPLSFQKLTSRMRQGQIAGVLMDGVLR